MFSSVIKHIRALFGNPEFLPLHEPVFKGNEKQYIIECIDTTFVSSVGKYVEQFENNLCDVTGAKHAIATINGTSALHVALLTAGVRSNSEVITQALSFVATSNAISYCGAIPTFVDIEKETLGMCPNSLASFLNECCEHSCEGTINKFTGRKVLACVPVHTLGHPCKIDDIISICDKYRLPVIEDAAESLGSYYKGRHSGTFGRFGIFSFNGNKIVTSGGGGAVITNCFEDAKKIKHITTTAKVPHQFEYYHDMTGFNYRLPNLNAALACAQLENLDAFVKNKRALALQYLNYFQNVKIPFFSETQNAKSNYWLNAIFLSDVKTRNDFIKECYKQNVMVRPLWQTLNKLPMYSDAFNHGLNVTESIADRTVNLPSGVRQ